MRIRFRGGTAAAMTAANPVLEAGEPGYTTDSGILKVGNGSTAWNSLLSVYTGSGPLFLPNQGGEPSQPAGGGLIYVEAGALKYKGSGGTVTVLAPA